MLFNSYEFILLFLPLTLAGFFLSAKYLGPSAARFWLLLASLGFYACWNPRYLLLIVGSMLGNFLLGVWLTRRRDQPRVRTLGLALGVAANLGTLAWYKYANFFLGQVGGLLGRNWTLGTIMLPLGISFFTFVQVAYLVDAARGQAREYRFSNYALFVTFFPHLVAGPIVHHTDLMPQFARPETFQFNLRKFTAGFSLFTLGLAKKILIADELAPSAQRIFAAAGAAQPLGAGDAWGGLAAYTFQIYFDFSGYSDMAIGLGLLFGIMFPFNFDSPYKSASVVEFWRRWHMTLSRFIRDYVYFPLGGSRRGVARVCINLMVAMTLAGLWHGANWTFILWGAAHGVALVVNHLWRWKHPLPASASVGPPSPFRHLAWASTFLFVMLTWVLFRSENLAASVRYFAALAGLGVPRGVPAPALMSTQFILFCIVLLPVVRFAPNTQQLLAAEVPLPVTPSRWRWMPERRWAVALGLLFAMCALSLSRVSEFLYWQF